MPVGPLHMKRKLIRTVARTVRLSLIAAAAGAAFLCAVLRPAPLSAQEAGPPRIMLGFKGGYSQLAGYYADQMRGAAMLGVSAIPYSFRFILLEADFAYGSHALKESGRSYLSVSTIGAGPLAYYSVFRFLELYAGVSFTFTFFHLKASALNREENAANPGFMVKAGIFIPLKWGVGARVGFEYLHTYISGRPFLALNYYAGVTYNFGHLLFPDREDRDDSARTLVRIDSLYRKGLDEMDRGDLGSARDAFREVLSLDSGHRESKRLFDLINEKEEVYRNAGEFLDQKQYYRAIPLLEDAGTLLPEANSRLADVRGMLSAEVPAMEKEGIDAYEKKDYEKCITVMQRLKLINPGNGVMRIYLPRALRRYEALQKLK